MKNINYKLVILLISLFIFSVITYTVVDSDSRVIKIDHVINNAISINHIPLLDNVMLFITKLGNPFEALLIFLVLSWFILNNKKKKEFYIFTIASALGMELPEIIKVILERIRPNSTLLIERSFSFPSGHATIATIFLISSLILVAPLIKNKISQLIFSFSVSIIFPLVAFSRIYLSVHWTSDVIAGIFLGIICYLIAEFCCQKKENVL